LGDDDDVECGSIECACIEGIEGCEEVIIIIIDEDAVDLLPILDDHSLRLAVSTKLSMSGTDVSSSFFKVICCW
jgi:hypothetical protein